MAYTVVTGADGGLGRELAMQSAQANQDLVLTGLSQEGLDQVKAEIEGKLHVKVATIALDLSKPDAPAQLHAFTQRNGFEVTRLINNAGFGDYAKFVDAKWGKLNAMMAVNMHAVAELTYLYGRDFVHQGDGKILNISSIAGTMPGPYMAMYFATKAFVRSLGLSLAYELRGTGVTITTVCPGPVATGFEKAASMRGKNFYSYVKPATAQQVAAFAFKKMMGGKPLAYAGWFAKAGSLAARLLPSRLMASIAATMNGGDPDAVPSQRQGGCPLRRLVRKEETRHAEQKAQDAAMGPRLE